MIEHTAFGAGMALLAGTFSRNLEAPLMKVYYAALSSALTTEEFTTAVERCIGEETFWPPVATIIGKVKQVGRSEPMTPAVDTAALIRRIEKLAVYSPHVGMIYPRVDVVREKLGEEIAYAYAAAGGQRVFSDNETTRSIAEQAFTRAAVEAARQPDAQLRIIGTDDSHLLESGNGEGR